jgi:hypothetical protein
LEPRREVGRRRVAEILQAEWDAIHARAATATMQPGSPSPATPDASRARAPDATPEELADTLIDLLVKQYPRTRAFTALLDSRTDWTIVRRRFRAQTLAGIKSALIACAPNLDGKAADIAAVVLNNMKTMVGMTMKDAPTSPGAPDELRFMNRLYLATRLTPGRPRPKSSRGD